MKKLLIFALLFVPVTSFAASSVRVLGSGSSALPGSGSATKTTSATPARAFSTAKVATPKAAAAAAAKAGDGSTSRIGTISAKVKKPVTTTTTTSTGSTASSGSRFPVITPAQSYNTVVKPQANTGTTVVPGDIDLVSIINAVKAEIEEDPRVDMIHAGNREAYWRDKVGNATVNKYLNDGYYFMWIEE